MQWLQVNRNWIVFLGVSLLLITLLILKISSFALETPPPRSVALTDKIECQGEVIYRGESEGISFELWKSHGHKNISQVGIDVPGPVSQTLYLYADRRRIVNPFITQLSPVGYLNTTGPTCFPLPDRIVSGDSIFFYVGDLFQEQYSVSLAFSTK